MKGLEEFVTACDDAIRLYAECWDSILLLPLEPLSNARLFEEAQRIVRECRRQTGDHTISWLKEQVEGSRSLVAEELDVTPDGAEWRRIDAALCGAVTALADDPLMLAA
jgi:hypothetical protein